MSEELKPGAAPGELSAGRPDREILMESATVRPNGDDCGECRVRRGMPAISTDGEEVG